MTTGREDLEAIGFEEVGSWHLRNGSPQFALNRQRDAAPVLYAFVIGAQVMYVGKTVRTLGDRLYGYQKGGGTQRTNIRVRNEIREALLHGRTVDILSFHEPRPWRVGRFGVNLPAALEDDVIETLKPAWNGTKSTARSSPGAESAARDVVHTRAEKQLAATHAEGGSHSEAVEGVPHFDVVVGKTYLRQGFFNVPTAHAHRFPDHGSEVEIALARSAAPVYAKVNRTANQTGAPRIMGGTGLRDWLRKEVREGCLVRVRVVSNRRLDISPI